MWSALRVNLFILLHRVWDTSLIDYFVCKTNPQSKNHEYKAEVIFLVHKFLNGNYNIKNSNFFIICLSKSELLKIVYLNPIYL